MWRITSTIDNLISITWPMLIVSMVIIISVRVCYLIRNKQHVVIYREIITLAMIVYVLMLFQIVTVQDVVSWSSNNFIPFKEMVRYKIGSRLFFKNIIGNVLLFLPFGLFSSYTLKNKEKGTLIVFLTILASLTIECVQMAIGRVFDVDDIILNTLGGYLGFVLYRLLDKIKNNAPEFCKKEWFLDIVSIIILMCIFAIIW